MASPTRWTKNDQATPSLLKDRFNSETPDLSHLSAADFRSVYEPAEDTFILLDALEADYNYIIQARPLISVEIGSGSGCVSVFVQKLLQKISTLHVCTDINPFALRVTRSTFAQNMLPGPNVVQTSLLSGLRLEKAIDLLLFNPPYVETLQEEFESARSGGGISATWAGGKAGMQLTQSLLDNLDQVLSPKIGTLYLVAVKENKPAEIIKSMQAKGFDAVVVLRRRAGREHLHVLRISHLP